MNRKTCDIKLVIQYEILILVNEIINIKKEEKNQEMNKIRKELILK